MADLKRRLDTLLDEACRTGALPGVVAMVCGRAGNRYQGAFGRRSLAAPATMRPDSVFWIASMTKALVSATALRLVERGLLQLDAPLAPRFMAFAHVPVLEGFDIDGTARTRAPRHPITLRHLLTHTAGFAYEYWNAAILRYRRTCALPGIGSGRLRALDLPLVADPGQAWEYGIATDWLGRLIEWASGQPLDVVLREQLLAPLGMHDTAFAISPTMRARLAPVHQRGPEGALVPTTLESPQTAEFAMAGSGLYATATDYCRFLRMILGHGQIDGCRVLEESSVAAMTHNQIGALRVRALRSVVPAVSQDFELYPECAKGFGFGFQIMLEDTPTGLPAGSLMWAGIANTYYWIDPRHDIAGVFLTQILPFADSRALAQFLAFQAAVYKSGPG